MGWVWGLLVVRANRGSGGEGGGGRIETIHLRVTANVFPSLTREVIILKLEENVFII